MRDEFPKDFLTVFEVHLRRAGDGYKGDPVHIFNVHRIAHRGAFYAVGIAKSIREHEIKILIDESGLAPIQDELL